MPSFEIPLAFFIATSIFAYMLGPAMLYASAQTMATAGEPDGWQRSEFTLVGTLMSPQPHLVWRSCLKLYLFSM